MINIVTVAKSTNEYIRKSEGDVIELNDGRLLIVYMEFGGAGSDFDCTRIVAKESDDGGINWVRHRVLVQTSYGDVNVYSPNIIRSTDGNILLVFMRKHSIKPPLTTIYVWKSYDEGKTFNPYSEIADKLEFCLCNSVIKRSRSGRLLLPVETPISSGDFCYSGAMYYSDDDGLNWTEAENRIYLPMRGVMEQHVEEICEGSLLMVMRNQLGSLFISESKDNGNLWSKPQTTGLRSPESCPELIRIPYTNDLLMIWNNSEYDPKFRSHFGKRSPLTASISRDNGLTWKNKQDIENCPLYAYSNPGCRFVSGARAIINYWKSEYSDDWAMSNNIDLEAAVIEIDWFYK